MLDPLFKKINNKKNGFFSFFHVLYPDLSWCFFNLLFNVILGKEKLKILIIVNFTVHLHFVQYQFNMEL